MCSHTVSLDSVPLALSYWKNIVAFGLSHNIIIFNAIAGSQTAVFSGHTDQVRSLAFSPDGISLVSGSYDKTVKLWDVQTGGVVKTFSGHTSWVRSVSISADCTRIVSGSSDKTIHLWDIQTGECYYVIKQQDHVCYAYFSPTNPQYLLSQSGGKIWQWDIDGNQIQPTYDGFHVVFSPDGTQFVLCNKAVVTVQNSASRAIVAKLHMPNGNTNCCCFSPDGRLVGVSAGVTVYVWDITGPDPCLVSTFIGHTRDISSLVFSSPTSLISASYDRSVKFWQINTSSTDPVEANTQSIPLTSAPIKSITLQPRYGITITNDLNGVVQIWDISTGICRTSFQAPADDFYYGDSQLIDGRLIIVWHAEEKIHIWDPEKGEFLQTVDAPGDRLDDLRISGDGSTIFCLYWTSIKAWSIWSGESVGVVEVEAVGPQRSLTVDGLKAWIHYPHSEYQGWDFGTPGSSPVQLPSIPTLHVGGPMVCDVSQSRIRDTITGKVVFQLSGRFAKPIDIQCGGGYLIARYNSGVVLILDFNHVFPQS